MSKLNIEPFQGDSSITYEVLDFDGNRAIKFFNGTSTDIEYDKKITFKFWADNSSGYDFNTNRVCRFGSGPIVYDYLVIHMDGSLMDVFYAQNEGKRFAIPNNEILDIEINKSQSFLDSFKINGITQTEIDVCTNGYNQAVWYIGTTLDNATIWDFKIYDTSSGGELIHYWPGYPDGCTNEAWVDQAGSFDGTVINLSGTATNRYLYEDVSVFGTPSKLELNLPSEELTGVADFNNNMRVVFSTDTNNPSIQYGKRLEWKMYLDAETGYAADGDVLFALIGNSSLSDRIRMVLDGSLLKMESQFSNGLFYPLEGLSNKVLNCSVEKTYRNIESFSIDEEIQTPIYSGNWGVGGRGGMCIAYGNLSNLHNATLWDIKIYDTSTAGSPLIHSWKGYPAGNTDAAWVDDVSTLDGNLSGLGGTRDIESSSSSGNVLTASRKLFVGEIVIPPETKTLYAGTSPDGSILTSEIITNSGSTPDVTFTSLGSENLGDVIGIDSYSRSGTTYIVYATDEGYFVNDTSGYNVNVTDVSITAFSGSSYFGLFIGDVSGGAYTSSDGGESWSDLEYDLGENQVNEVFSQSVRIL